MEAKVVAPRDVCSCYVLALDVSLLRTFNSPLYYFFNTRGGICFEVSTAVIAQAMVFWAVIPCTFVGGYLRFGDTFCPHHQGCNRDDELNQFLIVHTPTLKMKVACSSEISVSAYKSTRCHNSEGHGVK
jgi:hypothetical protein